MKGRVGVIVVAVVGLFIAGAVVLRPAKREKRAAPPNSVETPAPPDSAPAPQPVVVDPPDEAIAGLQVEVVNREGKALRGARILTRSHKPLLGTTDDTGIAVIPYSALLFEEKMDATQIRVEHDQYSPQFEMVRKSDARVRVTLRATAILDVEVVSKEAAPIPDGVIHVDEMQAGFLAHPAHPATRHWKADHTGRARVVGVPSGPLVVRAQAKGYEEGRTFVLAFEAERRAVRVVLAPGRRLVVTVRASTGDPLQDALVQFSDGSTWGMSSSMMGGYRTHYWEQRSNKNGVASFEHIPASMTKGVLRAKSSSHPKVSRNLELAPLLTEIEITLEAGGSLTAHVVDPEGKSVACKIVLTGPGIEGYDPLNQKEKAAGEKAVYEGVPAGPALSLTIYRFEGLVHIESGIVAMPSQTRDVLIRLPAQCKATFMARDRLGNPVSGSLELTRVRGALGVPVSGLPQDYLHYSRRIDESGKTELSVFVGLYKVRFQPHDGARVEKEVRIESDTTVDLDVTSQAALSGVVIDSGGAPVSGVVIYWIEGSEYWVAKSGLDGRFKFSRVIGRDGKLYAGHGGVTVEAYSGPAPLGDLRILFPMSTLRGRVTRTNGEPAPALVTISPVKFGSIAGDALSPVATKSDGTFEARVPSGLWKIFAFSEDASPNPRPMQVDLSAPGNVVDITYELQAAPKSP